MALDLINASANWLPLLSSVLLIVCSYNRFIKIGCRYDDKYDVIC